ncbi:MAG: hypothetical protein WD425_21920 [Nitrospirales bacterium]
MENPAGTLFDAIKFVRKRFYFLDGLLVTCLLIWIGIFIISEKFSETFRGISFYFFPEIPKETFLFLELGNYLAVFFVVLGIWLYKRRAPEFRSDEVGILFCSTNPPDLENQVLELQNKVRQQVKERDLLNLFTIKTIPPNVILNDNLQALQLVGKANAALIVWGYFESSRIDGREVVGFPKLKFVYSHPAKISPDYR